MGMRDEGISPATQELIPELKQGTQMSNVPFGPQLQSDSHGKVREPVGGAATCSFNGLLGGQAEFFWACPEEHAEEQLCFRMRRASNMEESKSQPQLSMHLQTASGNDTTANPATRSEVEHPPGVLHLPHLLSAAGPPPSLLPVASVPREALTQVSATACHWTLYVSQLISCW